MTTQVTPFVVTAYGEIDLDTAPRLHRELSRALVEHQEVVLDLSQVTFMDCSGLGVLVRARDQADRSGRRLVLRGVGRPVAQLLKLTGLACRLTPVPRPSTGRLPFVPDREGGRTR
ncbi:STAS domain-containing protein [Kitasatospora sp. NPDC059648]|uniref:STAS domain-containing protein n=1 Tax=Kitasatospora sp. NPDC059648 TaxID=3346894 RepID=UPI00367EECBC